MKQEKLIKEFEKLSKTPYSDKNGVYWMGRKDGWDEAMMNAKPFLIKALTQTRADERKKVLEEESNKEWEFIFKNSRLNSKGDRVVKYTIKALYNYK